MAKITKHIEVPMEDIMEMIRERYPEVREDHFEAPPFLEISEDGDYDRGTYIRQLKSITFYIYTS